MGMAGKVSEEAASLETIAVNEVRLVGKLSRSPEERVLPSGDTLWTFRIVIPRAAGGRSRQAVDTIDCAVWGGRVRQYLPSWSTDDVVEVSGSVRRRFYSRGGTVASRVEVEVAAGRIVRRAPVTTRAASE
jgi:single-strand DNA-binding protein